MNPGELRHQIIFQIPTGGEDEYGFPITEPTIYLKARAKLRTLRGRSFYEAAQPNMESNREFTIRYNKKLEESTRPSNLEVIWKNVPHEIVSIENDDGLNQTMTVIVKAVE